MLDEAKVQDMYAVEMAKLAAEIAEKEERIKVLTELIQTLGEALHDLR
jgi:SMC interacting uncharacterized protein involved in chromosome segregation